MAPVIRIDDDVMGKLKQHAVRLGLVFESPNATLRVILGIDHNNKSASKIMGDNEMPVSNRDNESSHTATSDDSKSLEIVLNSVYTMYKWALIPIPMRHRTFFPGYKVYFELVTNVGTIITHVTSALKGTPNSDPMGGRYIQTNLRKWFDNHSTLKEGSKLRFDVLEKGKRYRLSEIDS